MFTPTIVTPTLNQTIIDPGDVVVNQQGVDTDGQTEITTTTFTTTDTTADPQITADLVGTATTYYDDAQDSATKLVLDEIKDYAAKIKCDSFHGKGSIDDYTTLFEAAAKIANESKQIELDIDVTGFNEFSQAADDMSKLFTSFIVKLQNVSIINDLSFLRSISIALQKIWNLSVVFGKFKETILATSSVNLPKSAHDTKVLIEGIMGELNCSLNYINYFVNPTDVMPEHAALDASEVAIINNAVTAIDRWNVLCEEGLTIALTNNPDIQYINNANTELMAKTSQLQNATSKLKARFIQYNISH
jgi:hypothetical protein